MRHSLISAFLAATLISAAVPSLAAGQSPHSAIAAAVADPGRSPANLPRDRYRHPVETLSFFDVRPDQTVVEYIPGPGWYAEILAPMLKGKGRYIPLVPDLPKVKEAAAAMLAKNAARFGDVTLATVDFATGASSIAPGTADRVLTFRNVHNLMMANEDTAAHVFAAFYAALKPGGILGVVDHRLPESANSEREKSSGYVKRSTVIRLAAAAGFKLAGESKINANPKDTHDWPDGVWTLPPVLTLGEKDRARYLAIGESDRMTLKFVKPK
jgi:predicted methyltransferase